MIGVRRSCETAANSSRRMRFLAIETRDHLVDLAADAGDLVVARRGDADVAPALPHGGERGADRVEIAQRPPPSRREIHSTSAPA